LLVVNKPAGWNTHAPSPYAGEGIYDWLRHREPRWAGLAIVHRLDKDTSGVLVFAKSALANRSLTEQFTRREVRKRYLLLTDGHVPERPLRVATGMARDGARYVVRPSRAGTEDAVTVFTPEAPAAAAPLRAVLAEPVTGRTHQVRVHAAAQGFAVIGDRLYGGREAPRLCLHAAAITLRHPQSGAAVTFSVAADFEADPHRALRDAFIDPHQTDTWRVIHGASDGCPGWYVDRFGEYLLSQSEAALTEAHQRDLASWRARGVYHKRLSREVRRLAATGASPVHVAGDPAPARFVVRENGVRFEIGFGEGYSQGIFLDQRDNRRRLLVNHVAARFAPFPVGAEGRSLLNAFAYTCAFSVCAALAGAHVTSLDLSRRYLDWGRRNFSLNGLDPAAHEFIYGDALDWLHRLRKKGRVFDAIVLDPPTFSQSKARGTFRAERDFRHLAAAALPLLASGGTLLACTNAARLRPEPFLESLRSAVHAAGRHIAIEHYVAQPPDFPITGEEPGHLKSVWFRVR
jgi:23S rRNA (cytosine1962-C5)-methyltransferase